MPPTLTAAVLGAKGFLGSALAASILAAGRLSDARGGPADARLLCPVGKLVLFDLALPEAPPNPHGIEVVCLAGDISNAEDVKTAVEGADAVFHLAAVVSGQAERDYALGRKVNVRGTENVCEVLSEAAKGGNKARVVFTSSVATFSVDDAALASETKGWLSDDAPQRPLNTYGSQKAAMELLLTDLSRRGALDAVTVRLPTVSVRPGLPNAAASSFVSGIVREPLTGKRARCPVPRGEIEETRIWICSPSAAVEWLRWAAVVDTSVPGWGAFRSVTPPGISASVAEMLDAAEAAKPGAKALVDFEPDDAVMAIVRSWPPGFHTERGKALGFAPMEGGIAAVVREFLESGVEATLRARGE
ncbi:NAD dependent epimerase/dehydratase family protein [Hyaloraphidium curvatum]|nr:NAD dependent epimerase/dehydratase family protein [Hyaloraphidium curvatum]